MKRILALLVIVASLLAACSPATTPSPSKPAATPTSAPPIILGDVASLSGAFAFEGTVTNQGAILAVEEINQHGGVLGRQLQLVTRDNKSLPDEATNAFRELVTENATVIIGSVVPSASIAAMIPLAKESKVPLFAVLGYTGSFTEAAGHRYFFRLSTNDRVIGAPMADFLVKQKYTKYAVIGNDYVYGHSITDGVMNRLKQQKPDVQTVSESWVPVGATDLTANITAIMAKKPEAVMFGGLVAPSVSAFVKQAISFGLFKSAMGVHPSLGMPLNNYGMTTKEDVPEGILTGTDYPYPPVDTTANKAFFDSYKKRWNQLPYEGSANAYTTVKFIASALQKAGKVDREAFIDAAEGLSIEHPALGNITLRPFDHQSTAGWWMGYLIWDQANSRPGMRDIWYQKAEPYLLTQEQIQALRASK